MLVEEAIQNAAAELALKNEWPNTVRMRRGVYERLRDEVGYPRALAVMPEEEDERLVLYVATGELEIEVVDDPGPGMFWIGTVERPPPFDPEDMLHL